MSNHLGHVLVTISDRKIQVSDNGQPATVSYYTADVVNATDYYPGGMQQPGRVFNSSSYRYGFNGKENDPEIKTQDYGFRIYDYRLAKFLSVDPLTKEYPELTPYQFASNTPIKAVDLDGLETSWRPEGQLKPRENDNSSRSESTAQYATVNRELYATRSNEKPQPTIGPCDHCPKRIPTSDDNKPNIRSPESDPVVQQIKKDNIEKVENSPTNIFPVISNLKKSGKYELMGMHKEAASSLKDAAIEAGVSYGVGKIFQFGYRYFTAAKGGVNAVEQVTVHGNSLKSLKPTWGYKLYSQDGTFLKNGITSAVKAESRYTKAFMSDKVMLEKTLFPNRAAAYQWEFQQNQILRGPLNFNMH